MSLPDLQYRNNDPSENVQVAMHACRAVTVRGGRIFGIRIAAYSRKANAHGTAIPSRFRPIQTIKPAITTLPISDTNSITVLSALLLAAELCCLAYESSRRRKFCPVLLRK